VTRVADMRVTSEVTAHTYSNGTLLTCAMTSKLKALGGEAYCDCLTTRRTDCCCYCSVASLLNTLTYVLLLTCHTGKRLTVVTCSWSMPPC